MSSLTLHDAQTIRIRLKRGAFGGEYDFVSLDFEDDKGHLVFEVHVYPTGAAKAQVIVEDLRVTAQEEVAHV